MGNKATVLKMACGPCGGTGIVRGSREPKGIGVVCFRCGGRGAIDLTYTPFIKRVRRRDVKFIETSPVFLIEGKRSSRVSYASFLRGKMPEIVQKRRARRS